MKDILSKVKKVILINIKRINQIEKLIKKLKIYNKKLEQFAYISSHNLKEPLRTIINFLLLLQKKYENNLNEDVNEYIEYAIDASKRLNMIIDDLLEYSQLIAKMRKLKHLSTKKSEKL